MLEKVPCIRLDHLTDKQRREYAIRHNRTAELSEYDWDKLREECAQLSIEGQDFPELNFTFDDFGRPEPEESPEGFKEFGEETETAHKCPRCGYEWN
jgi:hypothetical protein